MKESTLIEIMKVACKHWQDHMNEGVLPERASVDIRITGDSITVDGVLPSPDGKRCMTLFYLRKSDDNSWQNNTQLMNDLWKKDKMLYEPSKEKQPAEEGRQTV